MNFFLNILDSINWEEILNMTILFNKDKKFFFILKMMNNLILDVGIFDFININLNVEMYFNFICIFCFGKVELVYYL